MAKQNTTKKHIVTSFHNLTPELQDAVKEKYPLGFSEATVSYTHLRAPRD